MFTLVSLVWLCECWGLGLWEEVRTEVLKICSVSSEQS